MNKSRLDLWQSFLQYEQYRQKVKLSTRFEALLDYCQYIIHVQFDKNTKKKYHFKKRKLDVGQEHINAIKQLSQDEKLDYYLKLMRILKGILEAQDDGLEYKSDIKENIISSDTYSRSYNLKIWKQKKLRLDRQKHILYAEREDKIKTYDLEDYILRISKNTDYHCFVLEAINNKPHEKSRTVHLGFKEASKLEYWLKELKIIYNNIYYNFVKAQIKDGNTKLYKSYLFGNKAESTVLDNVELSKSMIDPNHSRRIDLPVEKRKEEKIDQEEKKENNNYQFFKTVPNFQSFETVRSEKDRFEEPEQQQEEPRQRTKTIIESLANIHADDDEQIMKIEENEMLFQRQQKKQYPNIFHRIMTDYSLDDIQNTMNYGNLKAQGSLRVLGHLEEHKKIKAFIELSKDKISCEEVLTVISTPELMRRCNPEIDQMEIKTLIKSENSAFIYHINKAYNKMYRCRDFIYLRHIFRKENKLFMIDKSIENVNYPPFITIVRGQLSIIWAIQEEQNCIKVIADVQMSNEGYLNDTQEINLIMKYLMPFSNLEEIILQHKLELSKYIVFDYNWDISPKSSISEPKPQIVLKEEGFKKKKVIEVEKTTKETLKISEQIEQSKIEKNKNGLNPQKKSIVKEYEKKEEKKIEKEKIIKVQQSPFKAHLQNKIEQEKGQIDENYSPDIMVSDVQRNLDENGFVVVSDSFIKTKYQLFPVQKKDPVYQEAIKGHPIWKGEWKHDKKNGGIIFINQKKIKDQEGVLRFILAKIGKNILQRKSVLQISLPVDIFSAESNLERLLYSMTYAPKFLDEAAKIKNNALQQFKLVIGFGLSNSPLYLNMEKPFNPILGQTFQCWINGCPAYAQQISHHPPIAALLFEGRGYRITAQLQSKVELHMNSGCGTNDGIYKVNFENGSEVCFITPGGEVSGLTYGDRKFNIVGKSFYWIEKQLIFVQIVFDPAKKGFFSMGKQEKPSDFFEGEIYKVSSEFMKTFISGKRKGPSEKEISSKLGKIHGIWNKYFKFNEDTLLDIDFEFPIKLQYEANPLPSDANWREDIEYRRLYQIPKAQSEKERLEVKQRKDRKLREEHKKKKK